MKTLISLVLIVLLIPSLALAGDCPAGVLWSRASSAVTALEPGILMVMPNGEGDAFTAAKTYGGQVVDATVTVTVRDCDGTPVSDFPREDLWLESADGRMAFCAGGTTADANTNTDGVTTWREPLRAGGESIAGLVVMLAGSPLRGDPLPLHIISPDFNGDLQVNLTDAGAFAGFWWGGYARQADFNHDNVVNLSDVVMMSEAVGVACN